MTDFNENDFYIGDDPKITVHPQKKHRALISKEIAKFEYKKYSQTPFINSAFGQTKMKCKLLKISRNVKGFPSYHFQINGKFFFYGFLGIQQDDKIVLKCTKSYQKEQLDYPCGCQSFILATEGLIKIIEKNPQKRMDRRKTGRNYPKTLDKSDPRVYDINNYNINSFEIRRGHRCLGTELDAYIKKYKP